MGNLNDAGSESLHVDPPAAARGVVLIKKALLRNFDMANLTTAHSGRPLSRNENSARSDSGSEKRYSLDVGFSICPDRSKALCPFISYDS